MVASIVIFFQSLIIGIFVLDKFNNYKEAIHLRVPIKKNGVMRLDEVKNGANIRINYKGMDSIIYTAKVINNSVLDKKIYIRTEFINGTSKQEILEYNSDSFKNFNVLNNTNQVPDEVRTFDFSEELNRQLKEAKDTDDILAVSVLENTINKINEKIKSI